MQRALGAMRTSPHPLALFRPTSARTSITPPPPHNRETRAAYWEMRAANQRLVAEAMALKGAAARSQQQRQQEAAVSGPLPDLGAGSLLCGADAGAAVVPTSPHAAAAAAAAPGSSGGAGSSGGNGAGTSGTGRPRRGDLVRQVAQLRALAASAAEGQQQLRARAAALAAEKEAAEGSERLVSAQTAALLAERARLLEEVAAGRDAVRAVEAVAGRMAHQLSLALDDRDALLSRLAGLVAPDELRAIEAAMRLDDDSGDGGDGLDGLGGGLSGGGLEGAGLDGASLQDAPPLGDGAAAVAAEAAA